MPKILLVDDEQSMLNVLTSVLQHEDYEVVAALDGETALKHIEAEDFDLMISDIRMMPMNGMELLKLAHEAKPEMAKLMMTAYSSIETAIEAQKLGAFDYILKPFKVDELLLSIKQALKFRNSLVEDETSEAQTSDFYFGNIIANSPAMQHACDRIKQVAPVDTPILITGQTGTGKLLCAKTIHAFSQRQANAFVAFKCVDYTEEDSATALFGTTNEPGALEKADGGTLYIDEISSLPMSLQENLLIAMKEKVFQHVGSSKNVDANVRIIASTSIPLETLAAKGVDKFREDLYYSLSSISIETPPLSACPEDIIPIAHHIILSNTEEGQRPTISQEVDGILTSYTWPGNVEELIEVVHQSLSALEDNVITKKSLPENVASTPIIARQAGDQDEITGHGRNLKSFIKSKERSLLEEIISESGGDKLKAAQALNISLAELERKLAND